VPGYASSIAYHPNGMVNTITHANGVTLTQGLDSNGMQRPASYQTSGALNATGTAAANWATGSYTRYDGAGNLTRIGSSHFLYDGVSRIKRGHVWDGRTTGLGQARIQDFTHDAFGNLTSIVGSAGAPGRSIPVSTATNRLSGVVSHDAAGNLTSWNGNSYSYGPFGESWRTVTAAGAETLHLYTASEERLWSYPVGGTETNSWTLRGLDGKVLREFRFNRVTSTWWVEASISKFTDSYVLQIARHEATLQR
jgi:hypothetical protein